MRFTERDIDHFDDRLVLKNIFNTGKFAFCARMLTNSGLSYFAKETQWTAANER